MSILDINLVDLISLDNVAGDTILTISDHLDWDDSYYHLNVLQEKINSYLRFIESGELYENYPKAMGTSIIINVVGKYAFPIEAIDFFGKVSEVLDQINVGIRYRYLTMKKYE